jgi:hypothetical protein
MNKLDRVALLVRTLTERVTVLEAILAARSAKRKTGATMGTSKRGYVNIPQAESDKRWNLWATYHHLKILETCGRVYNRRRGDFLPTSKAWFAEHVKDEAGLRFNLRDLERWFSPRNTFPVGSRQDLRIRGAIQREIDRLRAAGYFIGMARSEIDRFHTATVM